MLIKNFIKQNFLEKIHILTASCVKRLFLYFGLTLISQKAYKELLAERANAINLLILERPVVREVGLASIVFSCDRALQLYSFIESYLKFVSDPIPLTIIYKCTNQEYEHSYRELISEVSRSKIPISFIKERLNFRSTLIDELVKIKMRNVIFFTDDTLFIRKTSLSDAKLMDPKTSILSLRHGPHLRESYTSNHSHTPPKFRLVTNAPKLLEFDWFEKGAEWSDPWSLDGQVLATDEVLVLAEISAYVAPNSFEGALKSYRDLVIGRKGICYQQSCIVNLPINRVQNEVPNRSGKDDAEYLLSKWKQGLAIDITTFEGLIPRSTHECLKLDFRLRSNTAFEQEAEND